jgi:hypothetical protein
MSKITESRYFHAAIVTLIGIALIAAFVPNSLALTVTFSPASGSSLSLGDTVTASYNNPNAGGSDYSQYDCTIIQVSGFTCSPAANTEVYGAKTGSFTCTATTSGSGSLTVQDVYDWNGRSVGATSAASYTIGTTTATATATPTTTATVTTTATATATTTTTSASFTWPDLDVIGWLQHIWSAVTSIPQTLLDGLTQLLMAAAYPAVVLADVVENIFADFYTVLATFINALISIPNTIIDVWNIGIFSAFPETWTIIMMSELFIVLGLRLYSFLKDVEILGNKI